MLPLGFPPPGISIHAPREGCDFVLIGVLCGPAISIHAPREGCDHICFLWGSLRREFQSTHPSRGATSGTNGSVAGFAISIHAPLTGCDSLIYDSNAHKKISIHAPLTGCDRISCTVIPEAGIFQSTHPSRGATPWPGCQSPSVQFQSTHPSRGATAALPERLVLAVISIHAPLPGCDCHRRWASQARRYFNPRTPHGVRHGDGLGVLGQALISIHAPLTGCDLSVRRADRRSAISIHAPLTGCDGGVRAYAPGAGDFNPRTPWGVRPYVFGAKNQATADFNPRTPWGVRRVRLAETGRTTDFNPRTPWGVRRPAESLFAV